MWRLPLYVRSILELRYEDAHLISAPLLNPICRTISPQESVRREKPEPGLIGFVELRQFVNHPFKNEKPPQAIRLWFGLACVPT